MKRINKREPYEKPPFLIGDENDFLDKLERESTKLSLLAKRDDFEIIHQVIAEDKIFMIQAEEDSFEFYYLLEGKVQEQSTMQIITPGNFITVQGYVQEKYFKTLTKSKFLMLSTFSVFDSLEEQFKELITLNEQVEDKDQYTSAHSTRLQDLSLKIGEQLGLTSRQLFILGYAAFLHDIGKIRIDSEILSKPGRLTEQEWEEMQKHPALGREIILEHLKEGFYRDVAEIVHQHHEKYDGTGYPQGLKGEEIMIEAQILGLVDAYDAMINNRPYHYPLSKEAAIAEIRRCKGGHFSPQVVEAFFQIKQDQST